MAIILRKTPSDSEEAIDIVPLTRDLNNGGSYGLQYPVISGYRPDRGLYMAWDRHTGEVKAVALSGNDSFDRHLVDKFAQNLTNDKFNPFIHDDVS